MQGFKGIKTGMTPTAGPCLASYYQISPSESICIVLLNTLTVAHRFEESKKLLAETLKKLHEDTGSKEYMLLLENLNSFTIEIAQSEAIEDLNNFEPEEDSEEGYDNDM